MKKVEISLIDHMGFVVDSVKWTVNDKHKNFILLEIDDNHWMFDENGLKEGMPKKEIWTVCYENSIVGYKGEALYYTCKALTDKDAINQAMRCEEFFSKIYMKHFDFKYFKAFKPQYPQKDEIGKVQYFEGDPRL
jgi:hypothetical protein